MKSDGIWNYNEDNLFRDTSSPCAMLSSNEVHPSRPQNSRKTFSASLAGITSLRSCPSLAGGSGIRVLLGRSFRTTEIISVRFTGAANPKSRRETVFGSRRPATWRRAMSITSQKYSVFVCQCYDQPPIYYQSMCTHAAQMTRKYVYLPLVGRRPSPMSSRRFLRVGFSRAIPSQYRMF